MILLLNSLLFSIFVSMPGAQAGATDLTGIPLIQKTIDKYNEIAAVKMQVKKTVLLSLLDKTMASEGELYFSKGKLRLEISKPEDSVIVMNEQAVWVETTMDGLDGAKKHVMKISSRDLKNRSKAPLALLLTDKKAWSDFKVVKKTCDDDLHTIRLAPKKKLSEMTEVTIIINSKDMQIQELKYQDEIENEVSYKFSNPDFETKIAKSKFKYVPPKGAEVVVY